MSEHRVYKSIRRLGEALQEFVNASDEDFREHGNSSFSQFEDEFYGDAAEMLQRIAHYYGWENLLR